MPTPCFLFVPLALSYTDLSRTRVEKVNAELVTLTYGTIVAQLCQDYDYDYAEVNAQLEKMGYNIGMRLIEDFLAKFLGREDAAILERRPKSSRRSDRCCCDFQ